MLLFLVVIGYYTVEVFCDISFVNPEYFHQISDLYQTPQGSVTTTTTQPLLPEIIINRKQSVYNYMKPPHSVYLPSQNPPNIPFGDAFESDFVQQVFPTNITGEESNPTEVHPPSGGYLPPHVNHESDFVNHHETGYHYDRPIKVHPTTTTLRPITHPTFVQSDISNQNNGNDDTMSSPSGSYLPPMGSERSAKSPQNSVRLQVVEMECMSNQGGFFKTILKLDNYLLTIPILENNSVDDRCTFVRQQSGLRIDIASSDFHKCGVAQCAEKHLCLKIRFPIIYGIKTASDPLLTLKCKLQDRIVAKTHSLQMELQENSVQERNFGAYVQGGSQRRFRTHVELLKKSYNGKTKTLDPHSKVQLGEELQIKAFIHDGDGWNFTRLSDVQLQRLGSSGEILNYATLITSSGCVNPAMKSICPSPPIFESPFSHRLTFKAVMFEGMKSGDEIVIVVKLSGCVDSKDCSNAYNNCSADWNNSKRLKRNAEYSDVSKVSFRVEIPKSGQTESTIDDDNQFIILGGILFLILILSLVIIALYLKVRD